MISHPLHKHFSVILVHGDPDGVGLSFHRGHPSQCRQLDLSLISPLAMWSHKSDLRDPILHAGRDVKEIEGAAPLES
jgi:hypothetical protein